MSITTEELPLDLDDRIKNYLVKNNEESDTTKHFIFIENSKLSSKLIFDIWKYKCPIPTSKDLGLTITRFINKK